MKWLGGTVPVRPDKGSLMTAGMWTQVIGVRSLLTGIKFWKLGSKRSFAEQEEKLDNYLGSYQL